MTDQEATSTTVEATPDEPVYVRELRFAHIAGTHESYAGDCPLCEVVRRAKVLGDDAEQEMVMGLSSEEFINAKWNHYLDAINEPPERLGEQHAEYAGARATADRLLEGIEHERHEAEMDFSYEGCEACDDMAVMLARQAAGVVPGVGESGGAIADAVERAAQAIAAEADRDADDGIKLPVGLPLPAPGDIVMYVLNQGASRGHPRPMMVTSVSQNIANSLPLLAGFVFLEGHDGIENNDKVRMLYAAVRGVRYDDSPAIARQFVEGTWHYREQAFPTFQLLPTGEWARVVVGAETENLPDTEGELPEPRIALEERADDDRPD